MHDMQFGVDARASGPLIAELAQPALGPSKHNWRRIGSLTSGGPQRVRGEVSYGAAKAGLVNYTMSTAAELGARGITANS